MERCGEKEMAALVSRIRTDAVGGLKSVDEVLASFPNDPRLHFMRGSLLAGQGAPLEAHASLRKAVELAPDFHIARYQLGFFELTSGEVDGALSTWGPLLRLPETAYLRKFVEGLTYLIRDEFRTAINSMQEGIALNRENEPLNDDIRLLIEECEKTAARGTGAETGAETLDRSATSVILDQFADRSTRH